VVFDYVNYLVINTLFTCPSKCETFESIYITNTTTTTAAAANHNLPAQVNLIPNILKECCLLSKDKKKK